MTQPLPALARSFTAILCSAALFMTVVPQPSHADDDGPRKPRIDCSNPKNKTKPACKPHHGISDDEIINGAYWLTHTGRHHEAMALLKTVEDKDNPRALNAMGFTTRKLGDVDGALPYYARALALEPDYVQAREYLGEAFLAKGDIVHAQTQLDEIALRCGVSCVSFANLEREIAAFTARQASRG